jgi:hypothetical protein
MTARSGQARDPARHRGMKQCRQTLHEYVFGGPGAGRASSRIRLLMPSTPTRLTKKAHYRWSARWAGQGRLPFAPKTGKRPG